MKPIELTMQAFGSYGEKTVIDFTKTNQNLFLITGDTGSGKSTIFDAVVFALYGEASSENNKKDGKELQSQFVPYDVTPYVQLTFSDGDDRAVYTVRRTPRHWRMLKRGSGITDEKETVSLILPSGREYSQNQKTTNEELKRIVGLDKNQFMQVAMIAQGEFVELLRAESNKKKEIFRKLFGTELFRNIVSELDARLKVKQGEMNSIKSACQAEVHHVQIPEQDEAYVTMMQMKENLTSTDNLNMEEMRRFLDNLKALWERISVQKADAEKAYHAASDIRDEKRDAYTVGEGLLASFAQLENAEKELAECKAEEENIRLTKELILQIRNAYDIKTAHLSAEEMQSTVKETEKQLQMLLEKLPIYQKDLAETEKNKKEKSICRDKKRDAYARIEQKVKIALDAFFKMDETKSRIEKAENDLEKANEEKETAEAEIRVFLQKENAWKHRAEDLSGADVKWEMQKAKVAKAKEILQAVQEAENQADAITLQKETLDAARTAYGVARDTYEGANREYMQKYTAFLDAQAGFIARESLHEGKPCPVCGSLDHPHPCELSDADKELTREEIDRLSEKIRDLKQEQEKAAALAGKEKAVLEEKEKQLENATADIRQAITDYMGVDTKTQSLPDLKTHAEQYAKEANALCKTYEADAGILASVQQNLQNADAEKTALQEQLENKKQALAAIEKNLASEKSVYDVLDKQKDFANKEEAETLLQTATAEKDDAENAYDVWESRFDVAKKAVENAETQIADCRDHLPKQKKKCEEKETAYQNLLLEKHMTEENWISIASTHELNEIQDLDNRVQQHLEKKNRADGAKETAIKAIDGKEKPILDVLIDEKDKAETELKQAKELFENLQNACTEDEKAYGALSSKMEKRGKMMEEYATINSLYLRLAGKVKDAKMDIETFVQRYYLQNALYAANTRFAEMSAGQFELRMVNEEQAGAGKNHGLDLMVYSTVTGKEREVRTLSGGESFMAALSMALGMADQIQSDSASIHLDMMFIDEGFGSLDEHSRNQAVRVLQNMAGGSKMIGIISHVSELKQEIEDQLLVRKDENGSHVQWRIS